jgi:signal transduction histidine kinase
MKAELSRLSDHYLAALRRQIKPGAKASLATAARLGHRAVALGLETLDLARIHKQALITLVPPGASSKSSARMIRQAKTFFAEAIIPIEKTHRIALADDHNLQQLNRTLRQRTLESSASARHLKRGIAQRQTAEAALKRSGIQCHKLLVESRHLQQHSQRLTHGILLAQEDDWQKISHQLHDEIAQILLGVHVRLLALKRAARANTGNLKKDIASTQRLVQMSGRTVQQFAHELSLHHET